MVVNNIICVFVSVFIIGLIILPEVGIGGAALVLIIGFLGVILVVLNDEFCENRGYLKAISALLLFLFFEVIAYGIYTEINHPKNQARFYIFIISAIYIAGSGLTSLKNIISIFRSLD